MRALEECWWLLAVLPGVWQVFSKVSFSSPLSTCSHFDSIPFLSSSFHSIRCTKAHALLESDHFFPKEKKILCGKYTQEEGAMISDHGVSVMFIHLLRG